MKGPTLPVVSSRDRRLGGTEALTDLPKKNLLVALDGSEFAESALDLARRVVGATGDVLHLVIVPEVYGIDLAWYASAAAPGSGVEAPITELMNEARAEATDYIARIKERQTNEGSSIVAHIDEREPSEAILAVAEEVDAWLIALATHGRGGVTRWAFGSVADTILKEAKRPVLLVRSAQPLGELSHIMVPLDGSPRAEAVLPDVERLARAARAKVTLMSVVRDPSSATIAPRFLDARRRHAEHTQSYLESQAHGLKAVGIDARSAVVTARSPAEAILDWEAEHEVDLVAMTSHGLSGLRRAAFGSVADRVTREGIAPVLVKRVD
jgi:nucleotide-binding universal stress UspA family protein